MKKSLLIILSLSGLSVCTVKAQSTDVFKPSVNAQDTAKFIPSGKPEMQIFTDFNSSFANGHNVNKFEVTRAYLGYGYNFSSSISARVLLEVGNPGVGNFQMTALLKNAYLQYQKEKLTVKFGLIGTPLFNVQEQFWGYRYIFKSFEDKYGMGPSYDYGLCASYKFNEILSVDAIIQNGEGYKQLDADSTLKAGIGLTIHPFKNITIRSYYDHMNKAHVVQQTIALMAGYANESFRLGAEYNYQLSNNLKSGHDFSGYTFYGSYIVNTRISLLARYDYINSVKNSDLPIPWNYANDGQQFIAGFEYILMKGIKISPNYQGWRPRDDSRSFISAVFLNVGITL